LQVTPVGSPVTDKATLPMKPLTGVTVIASVPPAFCCKLSVLAAGVSVKLGAGEIVNDWETGVAAEKLALPAWEATIVQVPALTAAAV
jgi:hypothetical protein